MTDTITSPSFPKGIGPLRSEAEVRAARVPDNLKALKVIAEAAREAFHAHTYKGDPADIAALVAHDIEEKRLLSATSKARLAYERALEAHIASVVA
jgi:hypothetical protein